MSKDRMLGYNKPFTPNSKAPGLRPQARMKKKRPKFEKPEVKSEIDTDFTAERLSDLVETVKALGKKPTLPLRCQCCRQPIDHVVMSVFNYDGTDHDDKFPIIELKEIPLHTCPENAVYMEATPNWTDYELTEEEQIEGIRCPCCGKFPFARNEVQVYDIVRVVCFTE